MDLELVFLEISFQTINGKITTTTNAKQEVKQEEITIQTIETHRKH